MADVKSKADLLKAGYGGYSGWGEAEALADYRATGGSGKYDVSTPAVQQAGYSPANYAQSLTQAPQGNWQDMLKQATQMYQQAIQPQIQAIQAMPAQAESRYQQLLADIKGETQKGVTQEMTRRGIPVSSGMTQDIVGQRVAAPIAQAGQIREESLANIAQQLAALQSGAMTGGINTGLSLYGTQMGAQESAANRALQLQQLQQQQNQPMTLGEGQTLYDPQTGQAIYTAPKTYAPKEETDLSWLTSLFGGNLGENTTTQASGTEPKPNYSPRDMQAGATSAQGQWYFTGSDWVPIVD